MKKINLGVVSFKADFLEEVTEDIIYDTGIFLNDKWSYDMHQKAYFMANGEYKLKKWLTKKGYEEDPEDFRKRVMEYIKNERDALEDRQINRLEYGYVVSCHRFQGSEAGKIVVFDESHIFGKDAHKWLYVAITRAKEKLVIIR